MRSYKRSISTTWEWRKVKITPAARPSNGARRRRSAERGAPCFDRRVRHIQVKWRGGVEAHWALNDGRGWMYVPGHVCLHDALAELLESNGP